MEVPHYSETREESFVLDESPQQIENFATILKEKNLNEKHSEATNKKATLALESVFVWAKSR